MQEPVKVLTVGGSDPCGAFGVYADLKTFTALGGYGMGVVTVVTAQNSVGWYGAEFVRPELIAQQLDAVLGDYGAGAVKTGFLGRVEVIEVVAMKLREYGVEKVVVDTVLVNNRGKGMFGAEVTAAYQELLFPLATVITPNVWEAAVLLGEEPQAELDGREVAEALYELLGGGAVFLKRTRMDETQIEDLFFDGEQMALLGTPRMETRNVSGSGDTLSAAIVVGLAEGRPLFEAVERGQAFTHRALQVAQGWRLAEGNGPLGQWGAAGGNGVVD